MLTTVSIVLASVVGVGLVFVYIPFISLIRKLARQADTPVQDSECPPVALVLSLRGGDPFLNDCLTRLLEQDYPDYELFIAFDNENDPAVKYVNQVIDERQPKNLTVKYIKDRPSKCTLLNHNYAQIVKQLDPRFQFVVFLDADAVTWPEWLRTLVQPMIRDENIGATSGNRWYTPDQASFGALVRAVWNMGSVMEMASLGYPWGGSMAMRTEIAKSPEMIERWESTFTGDTPTFEVVKKAGKRFHFSSDVIVQNREGTSLRDFCNWMPRQLLNGRLYHPHWNAVLLHAFASSLLLIVCLAVNITNIVTGNWIGFAYLGGSLMGYWLSMFYFFLSINSIVMRRRQTGEERSWLTITAIIKLFWTVPLVQFVYFWGVLKCLRIKDVTWRGIDYVIRKPFDIQLVEYKPFESSAAPAEGTQSL